MYANKFCYAGQVPIFRYFEACKGHLKAAKHSFFISLVLKNIFIQSKYDSPTHSPAWHQFSTLNVHFTVNWQFLFPVPTAEKTCSLAQETTLSIEDLLFKCQKAEECTYFVTFDLMQPFDNFDTSFDSYETQDTT